MCPNLRINQNQFFITLMHFLIFRQASTPSGENTDRNPMSMLSVSSESLDQIVNREKYLQATFESMSGAEMDTPSKYIHY